jgi:hypothetical protein
MSERRKIIQQLQEWINKINEEIEKLIQDRYIHTCMIRELLKKSSEEESNDSEEEASVSDLSIEIIPPENKLKSFKSESEKKSTKTKAQEREEERAKARAWHLDRVKDKARRKK